MFCKKCGSKLAENEKFCSNCGAEVNNQVLADNVSSEVNTVKETVQPVKSSQTSYSQNINQNKNNNIIYIIIGIAIVAFIAVILLVFVLLGRKNNGSNSIVDPGNNVNPGNPIVTPTPTNYYKVNYKDFTFKIPENMIYSINGEQLTLGDEDGKWMAYLNIVDGSFNQVKSNKSMLQNYFQQNGYSSTAAELKNVNGVEFITLELSNGGESVIAAYTKLNSMKVAYFVVFNQNYTIDYNLLKELAPIVSTAVYSDSTFNMEIPNKFKFNIKEISEFAK